MNAIELTQILGNLSGVVAAIAVVVSLVYLSAQVRANSSLLKENTKAQLMAADFSSNEASMGLVLDLIRDPDVAKIVLQGLRGSPLSEVDRFRFEQWARCAIEGHMTFFVQLERGTVTNEVFDYWSNVVDRMCKLPGYSAFYQRMRPDLKPTFQAYMDKKITPAPEPEPTPEPQA